MTSPPEKKRARRLTGRRDTEQQDAAGYTASRNTQIKSVQSAGTPAAWFDQKFPGLANEHGEAVVEQTTKTGIVLVRVINKDFLGASLGEKGTPDAPTVFVEGEQRFYSYDPVEGIFVQQREPKLMEKLSAVLLQCARECSAGCQTEPLLRFRHTSHLRGALEIAQGILDKPYDYFAHDLTRFVPCANGMLRLEDKKLLPFSPSYRRRNKLAVAYDPKARCPLFIDTLMRPALDPDDLDLLQRWCGLALIGENLAQKIVILTGTAGGGKGTFVQILNGVIGQNNLAMLRPQLLDTRFELGRFLGKTLLYGPDVPENFLNRAGVSVLKSLVGADPATVEFKGSNESPAITGNFNVVATCNSRLTVHLEGDQDAWRRRLVVIPYEKPKPAEVIVDLADQILAKESSGVFNWMLEGLDELRADGWQLHMSAGQQTVVDDLLLESDALTLFVDEALAKEQGAQLTVTDAFAHYIEYCNQRGWTAALTRAKFGAEVVDAVARTHGLTTRNDVKAGGTKAQKGWVGLVMLASSDDQIELESWNS